MAVGCLQVDPEQGRGGKYWLQDPLAWTSCLEAERREKRNGSGSGSGGRDGL